MQLQGIKSELEETIHEVKGVIAPNNPRIVKAEELVRESSGQDLAKEAKDIGIAMKMLREVMREYKRGE